MTTERAALAVSAAALLLLWAGFHDVPNEWGDDWAGYLLQARALASGTVAAEMAANAAVIDGTDAQIGPYAYPWGYPLLLAALGPWVAWDPSALTTPGAAALVVLAGASYAMARAAVAPLHAATVAGLAVLQTPVLLSSLQLSSDLVFTALSIVALVIALGATRRLEDDGRVGIQRTTGLAAVAAAAFTVRSNGAVLMATHLTVVGLVAMTRADRRRAALTHAGLFAGLTGAGLAAYFATWPDGSLVHVRLLVFDPAMWPPRIAAHLRNLATFFPMDLLRGSAKLAVLAPVLAFAVTGAVTEFRRVLPLTLYVAGHLVLLTLFPYDQGARYYLPVVPPVVLLAWLGATSAWQASGARRLAPPAPAWRMVSAAAAAMGLLAAMSAARTALPERLAVLRGGTGPFSPATGVLVRYLRDAVPAERRIAYRKPRALRYLSGRSAVAITQAAHLDTVDVYVFDTEHADEQVLEPALAGTGFRPVFEHPPYRVYARQAAADATP